MEIHINKAYYYISTSDQRQHRIGGYNNQKKTELTHRTTVTNYYT